MLEIGLLHSQPLTISNFHFLSIVETYNFRVASPAVNQFVHSCHIHIYHVCGGTTAMFTLLRDMLHSHRAIT